MQYIKVIWVHNFEDEPIMYHQELDAEQFETRKVVTYKDGRIEKASELVYSEETYLSPVPMPPIDEINEDSQFIATEISEADFENIWCNVT